jgi:hypothetical protein
MTNIRSRTTHIKHYGISQLDDVSALLQVLSIKKYIWNLKTPSICLVYTILTCCSTENLENCCFLNSIHQNFNMWYALPRHKWSVKYLSWQQATKVMNVVFADVYHFNKKLRNSFWGGSSEWLCKPADADGAPYACYVMLQCIPGWNTFAQRHNWAALSVMSYACYKTQ